MRRWVIASALACTACFGGQTGEITDLTACRDAIGSQPLDEPSADAPPPRERLDAMTSSRELPLTSDAGSTTLTVAYAPTGEPATILGGPECVEPWLEVPVLVTLRTSDGALDEVLEGTALLSGADAVSVRASATLSELRGTLADPSRDTLEVELQSDPAALAGRVVLHAADEDPPDRELATF